MTKTQKWLLILTPVIIGGIIVAVKFLSKKTKIPTGDQKTGLPTTTKPVVNATTTPTSDFPLQVGSGSVINPNKSVMALQDELGIKIDGAFGAKTLAALQSQTGLTSIQNASQLQQVLTQIDNQDQTSNYNDATMVLLNKYNNGGVTFLNSLADSYWRSLNQQSDGTFVYGNAQFFVPSGTQFDINQVIPDIADIGTGQLIIMDNRTGSTNYWLADPTTIFIS